VTAVTVRPTEARPGDRVIAIDGTPWPHRIAVRAVEPDGTLRFVPPPGSVVAWNLYGGEARRVTVDRDVPPVVHGPPTPRLPAGHRPAPPGYRLRRRKRLAASTLRRPVPWSWEREADAIGGEWRTWGAGHVDSGPLNAMHNRGMIQVAEPVNGRGRLLFRAVGPGG
jgi:hypothetical protein